jgi:hypothetical protein
VKGAQAGSPATSELHHHQGHDLTRILTALRDLLGDGSAEAFHAFVTARNAAAGGPINPGSLHFWAKALGREPGGTG